MPDCNESSKVLDDRSPFPDRVTTEQLGMDDTAQPPIQPKASGNSLKETAWAVIVFAFLLGLVIGYYWLFAR